jgi:hypothetical protein
MHIIEQFNGGLYESIIASDEKLDSQLTDDDCITAQQQDQQPTANKKKKMSTKRQIT